MTFIVTDRFAVALLTYQMKKFQQGLDADQLEWMLPALESVRQRLSAHEIDDGENCRGLGVDHRWQTQPSGRVFCTKCGEERK